MSDLLAARSQMAVSLAFHIVFAAAGIAMPLLMVIAETRWIRTRDPVWLDLTKRWARGTAILFAVGAVSGTVLSFELGLLWPRFMQHAGPVIGMPFSLEGFAFFLEAIFLGVYLYGWNRVSARAHVLAGAIVAASGALSGIFVVAANAWMNSPAGFRVVDGRFVDIDPVGAMFNPAFPQQALHMTLAAYFSVAAAASAIHAAFLLRDPRNAFHRAAFAVTFPVMAVCALFQPLSGDLSARHIAERQPVKLAAAEGQFRTERGAPLRIGGWPDVERRETRGALEIPRGLSLLARHDPNAEVLGLETAPPSDWPPVPVVHVAFQVMVGCGSLLALVALWGIVLGWRTRGLPTARGFLRTATIVGPLGFVALEAGWVVTEVGRQPWIVKGVIRTSDAVTPMPHLIVPFLAITALYLFLAIVVAVLLRRQVFTAPVTDASGRLRRVA